MKTILKYMIYGLVIAPLMAFILLSCSSPESQTCPNPTTQEFTVDKEFTKVFAGANVSFGITHDKSLQRYTIKATGCGTDLSDMKLEVENGVLDIRFAKYRPERYRIDVRILSPLPIEVEYFKNPRMIREYLEGYPPEK